MMKYKRISSVLISAALAASMVLPAACPQAVMAVQVSDDDEEAESAEVIENVDSDAAGLSREETVAEEQLQVIHIGTPEELADIAKKAHLDSWSRDKMIILDQDIVLMSAQTDTIATFGGVFDGKGHTISQVSVSDNRAETGLFGTIQKSGVVRNLHVSGIISPAGSQGKVAGIAGINYGRIMDCSFEGTVEADSDVGGIVGLNMESGSVEDCTCGGAVTGRTATGGIAGRNQGKILRCTNSAEVNTTYSDTMITTDQLTDTLENILMTGEITTTENINAKTDMGGIAGFSSGVISSCTNNGLIGYEHVGYNIGGVVGRTSGFVQGCTNRGTIQGRKDVGGICGQLQPYLELDFSEGTLGEVDGQLDELNALIDRAAGNAKNNTNTATDTLNRLNHLTGNAKNSIRVMTDDAQNYADNAAEKVNRISGTMKGAFSDMSSAAGEAQSYLDNMSSKIRAAAGELDRFLGDFPLSEAELEKIRDAFTDLSGKADKVSGEIVRLMEDLGADNADPEKIRRDAEELLKAAAQQKEALETILGILDENAEEFPGIRDSEFYKSLKEMLDNTNSMTELLEKIRDMEIPTAEDLEGLVSDAEITLDELKKVVEALEGQSGDGRQSLEQLKKAVDEMQANGDISEEDAGKIREALDTMENALNEADGTATELRDILEKVKNDPDSLKEYITKIREDIPKAAEAMKKASGAAANALQLLIDAGVDLTGMDVSHLKEAVSDFRGAFSDTGNITGSLRRALDALAGMDLSVNSVSSTFRQAGTDLYTSLDSMLAETAKLNSQIREDVTGTTDDLQAISRQIDTIVQTLKDAIQEEWNKVEEDEKDKVRDVSEGISDEEIARASNGRITGGRNEGEILADNNVGGIVGMVGVELDLNPEEDIIRSGSSSLDYVFQARSIVDDARNNGHISARGKYTGGICGHMEMGIVKSGRNYGDIEGEDYIGGIAGYSVGELRSCSARSELEGHRYLGGIAGYGVNMNNNVSVITIAAEDPQYVGAIAGKVKEVDRTKIFGNRYYSETIHGIGGVSYEGIAEGVPYEEIMQVQEDDSTAVSDLKLTFRADGKAVATITCGYGKEVPADRIPAVPEKEGFFGEWSRQDYSAITSDEYIEAVYTRIEQVIRSHAARESGLPVIIAEGRFRKEHSPAVTQLIPEGDEEERMSVSIPDDGSDSHVIRYLTPDEKAKGWTLYLIGEDGTRTPLDAKSSGKYLTFTVDADAKAWKDGILEHIEKDASQKECTFTFSAEPDGRSVIGEFLSRIRP